MLPAPPPLPPTSVIRPELQFESGGCIAAAGVNRLLPPLGQTFTRRTEAATHFPLSSKGKGRVGGLPGRGGKDMLLQLTQRGPPPPATWRGVMSASAVKKCKKN